MLFLNYLRSNHRILDINPKHLINLLDEFYVDHSMLMPLRYYLIFLMWNVYMDFHQICHLCLCYICIINFNFFLNLKI